jgi:methyl-accepting chemotaxis protein
MRLIDDLKIGGKLALCGGIAVGVLIIVSILEIRSAGTTAELVRAMSIAASATRDQVEADMMHDAIARDVMAGLLAHRLDDAERIEDAQNRMKANISHFQELLDGNAKAPLPDGALAAIAQTQEQLRSYAAAAQHLLAQDYADIHAFKKAISSFDAEYDRLATAMEQSADAIDEHSQSMAEQAIGTAQNGIRVNAFLALSGVLTLSVAFLALARTFIRPLRAMRRSTDAYARGHYQTPIGQQVRKDEIGDLARSIDLLRRNSLEAVALREQVEKDRAEAERALNLALKAMAEQGERDTRHAVQAVAARTGDMTGSAADMVEGAACLSQGSANVASAAQQALSNNEAVAVTTQQLTSSISEIATQMNQANLLTRQAVDCGREAAEVIDHLESAVAKIGDVTKLINEIASQTNLLALNATIEAARAGETGKGFAVVAAEVKNLANQTARATDDIVAQVQDIQHATRMATDAVNAMTQTVYRVDAVSGAVAAAVKQQEVAAVDIARNIHEAADASRQVAQRISDVSNEAQRVANRSEGVKSMTSDMAHSIDELRQILIGVVRTATAAVERQQTETQAA